jgi:hypothetical protein
MFGRVLLRFFSIVIPLASYSHHLVTHVILYNRRNFISRWNEQIEIHDLTKATTTMKEINRLAATAAKVRVETAVEAQVRVETTVEATHTV